MRSGRLQSAALGCSMARLIAGCAVVSTKVVKKSILKVKHLLTDTSYPLNPAASDHILLDAF
jgi:hypothetical protein